MLQARELAPANPFEAQQDDAQAGAAAANGVAAAQTGSAQPDGRAGQAAAGEPNVTSSRTLSSHSSVGAAAPPWPPPPRLRPTPAAQGTANGRPHSESPAVSAQYIDGMAPHPVMQHVKQLAAKAAKEVKDVNTGDPVAWKRHGVTDARQSSVLSDSASSDGTQA
jgi:hypothetical protein